MNIGFLGLGKLGLPVSLAVEDKGHRVFGFDISKHAIKNSKKEIRKDIFKHDVRKKFPFKTKY